MEVEEMTEQEANRTFEIIYIAKLGALAFFTIGIIFFATPWLIERMQTEGGVCGKEFHGEITYISSLKSDKNVEGTFFLGMGSIRTERVYVAYTGDNQIGYRLIERPIAQSLLFEDTNQSPYIEEVSVLVCTEYGYTQEMRYKFHVPVGTIKMEYAV